MRELDEDSIVRVDWSIDMSQYVKYWLASLFSMLLGAQSVHLMYRPLDQDLSALVAEEKLKIKNRNAVDEN